MVTIRVPRNKLLGMFFFGSLISPAIKVTLFQASLENNELMIVAPIAPNKATPASLVTVMVPSGFKTVLEASHMWAKLFDNTSVWNPTYNPSMIIENKAISLAEVKIS